MNTYAKYCPNVWLAKSAELHKKGDIIAVANKYGKESDCEIHNLVVQNSNGYFYSVTRCDGVNRQTYAEKKAEKYQAWALSAAQKSTASWEAANEGRDFLHLAEPIKVGHHSEGRHRALFARNHARMDKSIELDKKAESHSSKSAYWEAMADKIDLSMPESIEYFAHELEKASAAHQAMKADPSKRAHSMDLAYSSKKVRDMTKNLEIATKLWA
jgi:hypothetical protein